MGLEDYYNYFGLVYDNDGYEMRRKTIYLILGYNCDLKCSYCFHTNHFDRKMPSFISPSLLDFLENRLPSKVTGKVNIQFWGGEPLLYAETVKALILHLSHISIYTFQIVTNGKNLTDDFVHFCNENNVIIGVSHDGVLNLKNRLYDPILDKHEIINKIKCFSGFSSVFTPQNSSFYEIYDYFKYHPLLDLDKRRTRIYPVVDTGLDDKISLFNDTLERESRRVVQHFKQNIENGYYQCEELDILKSNMASYFMSKKYPEVYNDLFNTMILNIDLEGNVYYDSGGSYKLGTVDTPLMKIRAIFILTHILYYNRWEECLKCKVKPICNGGQLMGDNNSKNFCNMYLKYFTPIIELLEE